MRFLTLLHNIRTALGNHPEGAFLPVVLLEEKLCVNCEKRSSGYGERLHRDRTQVQRQVPPLTHPLRKAVEMDPLSMPSRYCPTSILSLEGARKLLRRRMPPLNSARSFFAYFNLQNAYYVKIDFEKAAAAAEMALALSERHIWAMGILAETYAEWGKNAEAKAIYAELVARSAIG